jgi:hypothetical protein
MEDIEGQSGLCQPVLVAQVPANCYAAPQFGLGGKAGNAALCDGNRASHARDVRHRRVKMRSGFMIGGMIALVAAFSLPMAGEVQAQASECQKLQGMLQQRQGLVQRMNAASNSKKLDARGACTILNQISSNGSQVLKFMDVNKDWCQIPDAFVDNMKNDHERSNKIRNQACNAASQQAKAMQQQQQAVKQQREAQERGGFGGADVVTGGPWRVPQGAL